jgi:hypothetical protein
MLEHKVTLYIPSTKNISETLSENEQSIVIQDALSFLSKQFGGATALEAKGAWLSESGDLVTESVTLVYSFCEQFGEAEHKIVWAFAEGLKEKLSQEAIAVEIDNKLYFI